MTHHHHCHQPICTCCCRTLARLRVSNLSALLVVNKMIGSRHEKKWQSISCESICSLGSKSEIKYNAIFQRFINGTIKFMVTMVTICLCSYFMLHKLFYAKSVWKKLLYTNAEKRKFLFVLRVVCAVRKKNERFGFSCFNNEYIKRD